MSGYASPRGDRIKAGIGAALFQALLAWGLIAGLAERGRTTVREELRLIGIAVVPPPSPRENVVPLRKMAPKREGAASPPNLKTKATEIVAPKPPVRMPPPPIAAAPIQGIGAAPSAGAAPIAGPGTGAGGQGNGTGNGRSGNGEGGGGEGSPPIFLKGDLSDKDYPRRAAEAGAGGTVSVLYTVETNGRATECRITRSSGNADLDEGTCALIEKRYRYRPATDERGRPVRSKVSVNEEWVFHPPPPRPEPPPDRRSSD
jgi:periplasmic protein TonB